MYTLLGLKTIVIRKQVINTLRYLPQDLDRQVIVLHYPPCSTLWVF